MAVTPSSRPECEHDWEHYTDLPGGEEPYRYWKCTKCGILGYRKHHGYGGRKVRPTRALKCKKCGEPATTRCRGRDNLGRIRWACEDHA